MNKIGIKVGVDIKFLLKELLNLEFIENNIEKNCKLIILDIDILNLKSEVEHYCSYDLKVIILLDNFDRKELIELLSLNCSFQCILKHELNKLKDVVTKYFFRAKSYKSFYLNDIYFKGIIEFSEILYIDYYRTTRRVRFNLINNESFFIKRNFSDLDFLILEYQNFYRLGRGIIINMDLVKILDYKEEKIIFKDKTILYISKIKLKELERTRVFEKNRIVLKSL